MTLHVVALLLANALMLLLGAGLLPVLRMARSWREVVRRAGLAYMLGVAVAGTLSAHLALLTGALGISLGFGAAGLFVAAAASLALGSLRLRHAEPRAEAAPRVDPVGLAALAAAVVLVLDAARAFAVKPLAEWDGWAIWALKGRALYDFGGVHGAAFTGASYAPTHLSYPLLLPGLEALDFRLMGAFDGTVVHLQLALLALGFVGALWSLLRSVGWAPLLGVSALAIVAAPQVVYQLSTAYADVPLAFFVALGVAALGAWLETDDAALLALAALFTAAAALTKNEGAMFAAAAYLAAVVPARRRLRPLALAACATVAVVAPWRVWVAAHGISDRDYALSNALDPGYLRRASGRVAPSAHELAVQIADTGKWGLLVPLVAVGVAAALILRRRALAGYALAWLLLGFGGLLVTYWISTPALPPHLFNSSYRTIDSLIVGGAALVPLLVGRPGSAAATD